MPDPAPRIRPFVTLFNGRCGSTFLMEALDAHPAVRARPEWLPRGGDRRDPLEWTRRTLGPAQDPGVLATGFKVKPKDVTDLDAFAGVLRDVGAHVICLRRLNLVKQTVSMFNACRVEQATGDWNIYDQPPPDEPLHIDPDTFEKWLSGLARQDRELVSYCEGLGLPLLHVTYEQVLADVDAVLGRVYGFLGVEPAHTRGRAQKITSDDLREAVANFDGLRARFAGTPFEAQFDEGGGAGRSAEMPSAAGGPTMSS